MEKEERIVRIDEDGTRYASVPMWQELPKITVRLKNGHTTYLSLPAAMTGNAHFSKR